MRTWRWLVGVLVILVALPAGGSESSCGNGGLRDPVFGEAATAQSLRGVVESETIAANPLPWGRSVSAVTRVWGDVTVERLEISRRRFVTCPSPAFRPAGSVTYRFVGLQIEGADSDLVLDHRAADDVLAAVTAELGAPVLFSVSGTDRVMALVQAWLWEMIAGMLLFASIGTVALKIRRRRLERRDYLF